MYEASAPRQDYTSSERWSTREGRLQEAVAARFAELAPLEEAMQEAESKAAAGKVVEREVRGSSENADFYCACARTCVSLTSIFAHARACGARWGERCTGCVRTRLWCSLG